jgi:hypothetical protein
MTKKNTWLPGQPANQEPGRSRDNTGMPGQRVPASPLGLIVNGCAAFVIGVGIVWFGLAMQVFQRSVGGGLVILLGAAVFVFIAVFAFSVGIRRRNWRKKNTNLTGGVYLPVWAHTPDNPDRLR